MRNPLLSLLALGTLAIPADAQSPQHGLKTGYIAFNYTAEVLPGHVQHGANRQPITLQSGT